MDLDKRMKHYYEQSSQLTLVHRMPVIIRIDGKAFHTFTRGMSKPFDPYVTYAMEETTKKLCENVQGCVFGYTQSDEISLLLIDYASLETDAWFDDEVQKLVSVSASMATLYFNNFFREQVENDDSSDDSANTRRRKMDTALFDSRTFNIPREEATNYFYWRQRDAIRNSIASVGRSQFSPKVLHGKNTEMIKKLLLEKGVDWESYPANLRNGSGVIKDANDKWIVDGEIPVFTGEGRDYIEKLLNPDKEKNDETC